METIRELLSRIRWDEQFGRGRFEVGIFDRVEDAIEFHAFEELRLEKGNRFAFTLIKEGESLNIPYHRIREVRRDGECIWSRG